VTAYLDHAATTPMLPAALAAMTEQLAVVGNASSLHRTGRAARRAVEESREKIARCLGARPSEVVFTSGGTESDNLAVKGTYWARRDRDPGRVGGPGGAPPPPPRRACARRCAANHAKRVTTHHAASADP
jgi:cysteine desulfurase